MFPPCIDRSHGFVLGQKYLHVGVWLRGLQVFSEQSGKNMGWGAWIGKKTMKDIHDSDVRSKLANQRSLWKIHGPWPSMASEVTLFLSDFGGQAPRGFETVRSCSSGRHIRLPVTTSGIGGSTGDRDWYRVGRNYWVYCHDQGLGTVFPAWPPFRLQLQNTQSY